MLLAVLVTPSLLRAEDPAAVLAAIEARIAAMEEAVLAGDPGAYLGNVYRGDDPESVWGQEQRAWAADLVQHRPQHFDLVIDEFVETVDRWATVNLTMSWRMAGGSDRSVSFPAEFIDENAAGEWLYAGEKWDSTGGEGVLVFHEPDLKAVARRVVAVFPEVRAHCEEGFQTTVPGVQQVKLYTSMQHLQASIYLSYVEPLGGWNEPGESIKILAHRNTGRDHLQSVLAHEFGHVCTFVMGDHATHMPWWVLEGVAELAAERFNGDHRRVERTVRGWARRGVLAPWEDLADFRSTPLSAYAHVYAQGHHMLGFVSEHYGREARNEWLRAMARGGTLDEASRAALGIPFDELDLAWRESLAPGAAPE